MSDTEAGIGGLWSLRKRRSTRGAGQHDRISRKGICTHFLVNHLDHFFSLSPSLRLSFYPLYIYYNGLLSEERRQDLVGRASARLATMTMTPPSRSSDVLETLNNEKSAPLNCSFASAPPHGSACPHAASRPAAHDCFSDTGRLPASACRYSGAPPGFEKSKCQSARAPTSGATW